MIMREILFRGKRIDNGEWVYGDIHKNIDFSIAHIHPTGERVRSFNVIPETIGQYTGLKDGNGRKIFEGDIVIYVDDFCEIVYREDDAMFYAKFDNVLESFGNISGAWLDVIGTIHDEPEDGE